MATYIVTDPQTGRRLKLTGESPPTEQELEEIFANVGVGDMPAAPGESQRAPAATEPANSGADGGMLAEAGKWASAGNRSILQALGTPVTLAADALAYLPRKGFEAITGEQVPTYTETFDQGLSELGFQPGETTGQRLFGDAAGGVAAAATGVGLGQQLARSSGPLVRRVGGLLAGAPETQALAGGAAGLASGSAREAGAGPVGQTTAGLLAGVGAPMVAPRQVGGIPLRGGTAPADPSLVGPDAYIPPTGPTSEYRRAVSQLDDAGIPLTAGQRSGANWVKMTERTLSETPMTGTPLQRQFERQQRAYQQGLLKLVGLDDGSDMITRETLDKAGDALSARYASALADKRVSIADDDFLNTLASIEARHSQFVDDPSKARVRRIVNDFLDEAAKNGGDVTGEWYQAQRSLFAKRAMKNSEVSDLYADLKHALDDAFTRAAGDVKGNLDSQYARLKQLRGIFDGTGGSAASEGFVSPAQVARKASGAAGGREWQDFTRAASTVLPDRVGNSGTAQRNLVLGLLGGAGGMAIDPMSLIYGPAMMRGASQFLSSGQLPTAQGLLVDPIRQAGYPALLGAGQQMRRE